MFESELKLISLRLFKVIISSSTQLNMDLVCCVGSPVFHVICTPKFLLYFLCSYSFKTRGKYWDSLES